MKNLETSKATQQGNIPAMIIKDEKPPVLIISVSFNNVAKKT